MTEPLGLPQEPGEFPERSDTPVFLRDYDPRWPELFEAERARILEALPGLAVRVEHVGSTSVPQLAAKPILDIAVSITDLEEAPMCVVPLEGLGYSYAPEFEEQLPSRRYFRKDERPLHRTHHVHMYADGHPEFEAFLLFRDYLRAHPEERTRYEALKRDLAATKGRAEYTAGKDPFITQILARARATA